MDNYMYYFEVAAALNLLIVLYDMMTKKQYYRDDAKIFIRASVAQIALSLVDVLSCFLLEIADFIPLFINVFVVVVYFVLQALTIFYITLFPQAYSSHRINKKSKLYWVAVVLFLANAGLAVTSLFTKAYFYFEGTTYYQGELAALGYYFYFIMALGICIYAFMPNHNFLPGERLSLIVAMLINGLGVFIQYYFRTSLITGLATSIALLLLYVTLENPNSYMDKTTGSGNYESIRRRMETWRASSDRYAFITVRIDNLNHFEHFIEGDKSEEIISMLAEFLKTHFKSRRNVYRLDDRSITMIINGGRTEATECLGKLTFLESQKISLSTGKSYNLEYSVAACLYPEHAKTFNDFHTVTDYLLNELKGNANNHSFMANDETMKKLEYKDRVERALVKALQEDGVDLFFQPIYDTVKKRITGLEALSRLTDCEMGSIPPKDFIEIAERCGRIEELTQRQFEKVCRFINANLCRTDYDIENIHINLSPILLNRKEMVPWIIDKMHQYNIPVGMINFEITESATADSPEILAIAIKQLMEAGAVFSLDDYGTGYSNILYMANFPFVAIKFDKEMIWSYFEQDVFKTILNKEFELVQELGENIVAEGVETEEQLTALSEKGIRYIQGYYFSSPLSENRILEYLKAPAPEKWFSK